MLHRCQITIIRRNVTDMTHMVAIKFEYFKIGSRCPVRVKFGVPISINDMLIKGTNVFFFGVFLYGHHLTMFKWVIKIAELT